MTSDFERLIRPASVAIIGASSNPGYSVGGQPLRSLTEFGYTGSVFPVNPKHKVLNNRVCYPKVGDVPQPCDLALIALAAPYVPAAIEECGAADIPFAIVLSSGFRETGERGSALQEEVVAAVSRSGVRVIGPNCQGMMNLQTRLYCGFGTAFQRSDLRCGPLAMVTQSGGFGYSLVTRASDAGIGFNYVVSTGNECDISMLELLEYFLEQDDVEILVAFLEGIKDGKRLLALGERALKLGKPILIWKVGNSSSGKRASLSHTANLTSSAELYRAVFKHGGFIEIHDVYDLIDITRAFLSRKLPRGRNVAVVTGSGGVGVLLADRCEEQGFQLPALSKQTKGELKQFLPEFASVENPIDVTAHLAGDAIALNRAVSVLLNDADIDQVILHRGNATGEIGKKWATDLVQVAQGSEKPILVSLLQEQSPEALEIFNLNRIPWFPTPGDAVTGAGALYEYSEKLARFAKREERNLPRFEIKWPLNASILGEYKSKQILGIYGIPIAREVLLSVDEVLSLKESPLHFPLAVKLESPDFPHKTEAGVLRLGIADLVGLKNAALAIVEAVSDQNPDARIEGIILQEMVHGVEMILGVVHDEYFGPVVALGLGGIFTEVLRDVTHRCAPIDVSTAHVMIRELQGFPILEGIRGMPAVDIDALAETVSRLSMLAADHSDKIAEIDINPLFVRPGSEGVIAADALIVLRN